MFQMLTYDADRDEVSRDPGNFIGGPHPTGLLDPALAASIGIYSNSGSRWTFSLHGYLFTSVKPVFQTTPSFRNRTKGRILPNRCSNCYFPITDMYRRIFLTVSIWLCHCSDYL